MRSTTVYSSLSHLKACRLIKQVSELLLAVLQQTLRIQQVLRLVPPVGPAVGGSELYSYEITDLAIDAISHMSFEFLLWRGPTDLRSQRYRGFQLQARPGRRDVFQESHGFTALT